MACRTARSFRPWNGRMPVNMDDNRKTRCRIGGRPVARSLFRAHIAHSADQHLAIGARMGWRRTERSRNRESSRAMARMKMFDGDVAMDHPARWTAPGPRAI